MKNYGLILFVCAGLLLSGGTILGGSTAWSLLRMSYYFWTSDLGVELSSSVLFVSGSLICLPASWLATLVPYHPRSTTLLATLMILVTSGMMLLSIGVSSIMGLSRALRDTNALNTSMLRAMSFETAAVKSAFASMQLEMKCCGVNSPYDWYQYGRVLPPSCCGRVWIGKHLDHCESPLYTVGCLRPARAELRMYANSLAVLSCAIIIVKAVTLFAAAYTLVTNAPERRAGSKPQPLHIACLAAPLVGPPHTFPNAPPLL
ncbi:uncharacterized protein LOC123670508 [Melitaea cinxia]|uniref:uncharacterized protein LOC123670508 n=1 Tax=Melitaea cinxia TaxID=113334 RepID=UPI001E2732D2|nr:uncharacterized protein LOC123670508 [Melitaea cinxia]